MNHLSDTFIKKFHTLEGLTIAEKKKNLYILFNQSATFLNANVGELDTISSTLTPTTFLEELFKLEFLIYFKRVNELFALLKEGNDIFVSKIVKQEWMFKTFFDNIGIGGLIDDIFPNVSYSVRMKILGKLASYQDSETFDKIFDAVTKQYGIFIANKFIYNCTSPKIKKVIIEYPKIVIKPSLLKMLFRKDSTLILHYFTYTRNSIGSSCYNSLVQLIYIEDRNLFDILQKKYCIKLRLGRRLTKKVVNEKKLIIIEKPYEFRNLDFKTILRKIGSESEILFCNSLPNKFENYQEVSWLLKYFPRKYHYSLHFKTIQSHYKVKFIDYPKMIDSRLLKLIADNSERAVHAKIKVDNGDDDYIKYLQVQESIPLIKDKINLTSNISDRGSLIMTLVETSFINNDIEALHRVMKYFNFRHKNDDLEVHLKFIRNIEDSFGFKKFTEEMWNLLNELLLIHILKFDKDISTYRKIQSLSLVKFNLGISVQQKFSYLNFLINKNVSIDDLLLEYFSVDTNFPSWGSYSHKFEKYFLIFAIGKIKLEDSYKMHDFNCNLIEYIDSWNLHYQNDRISLYDFPSLANSFKQAIRHDVYWNSAIQNEFRSRIFTTISNIHRDEYLQVYWDRFQDLFQSNYNDLLWFLKFDLSTFITNFSKILDAMPKFSLNKQLKLWHVIKKYSHVSLDQITRDVYMSKISDKECFEEKDKLITCLSVLMQPADYMAFADYYKPNKSKLDLNDENEVRLYSLQCSVASNFKHTRCHKVLPSLFKYCVGDYFKNSLKSLYSILSKTPENLLPTYLNYLSAQAVSVRKHALYLTCELSTVTNVEHIVQQLSKNEGVQSLQKILFTTTMKYFVKNPDDQFFELIKLNMLFINKTDDESLHMIADGSVDQVPRKYKAAYLHYTWYFLEKTVDVWMKLSPLKRRLLQCLQDETICKEIPLEFALDVIKNHFMTDYQLPTINSFTFTLASVRPEIDTVFDTIKQILETSERDEVLVFFNHWYRNSMSLNKNLNFIQSFVQYFEKKIIIEDDFEEYVKLYFLKIKMGMSSEDQRLETVCIAIYKFIQNLTSEYGIYTISLFKEYLKQVISLGFTDENLSAIDYYYHLVQKFPDAIIALLVIGLINEPSRNYGKEWNIFIKTLNILEQNPDKGVQLFFKQKFKKTRYWAEQKFDETE